MSKPFLISFLLAMLLTGCKTKKNKPEVPAADFFPVKSYLQGQVAQLDTASFSFYKVQTANGLSDTVPVTNKEIKTYAAPFTTIPDISDAGIKNDYAIDHLYDDMLEAFVFTFTTREDHPVKREDVVLDPQLNAQGKNDIKSVFIQLYQTANDTTIQKNLLWEANKNFKIITTISGPNVAKQTNTIQIFWNGFSAKK